jgi:hypothetical protein
MAKVRKWKETLVLACVTLLMSVTQGWSRGRSDTATRGNLEYSRMISGITGKMAIGFELTSHKPYLRVVRASRIPVPVPLTPGAFLAMAALVADALPTPTSACGTGGGTTHGTSGCYTVKCPCDGICDSCGLGTCNNTFCVCC